MKTPPSISVGVLSLQGSVREHIAMLAKLPNVTPVEVKSPEKLEDADGIILPGGESTAISRLLREFGLWEPLKRKIEHGFPVWGTCAGMILLAKDIVGESPHLGLMDISVRRNAYGRQIDSFSARAKIPAFAEEEIPLVFIRAPWIESVGNGVEVLCSLNGHIVAAKERNMLATSFHPELTDCLCVHRYFADKMIRKNP